MVGLFSTEKLFFFGSVKAGNFFQAASYHGAACEAVPLKLHV
jgi:hypothetical protein